MEARCAFSASRTQTIDFRYTGLRGVQDTIPAGSTKYTFNYPTHSGVVAWQGSVAAA